MWLLISCLKEKEKVPNIDNIEPPPPPPYDIAVSEHRVAIYEVWNSHVSPGDAMRIHHPSHTGAVLTETQTVEIAHVLKKCGSLVRHICCAKGENFANPGVICKFVQSDLLRTSVVRLLTHSLTATVHYTPHGVQVHFFQVPPCMHHPDPVIPPPSYDGKASA